MEGLRKPYLAAFRMAVRRAALRRTVEHVAHLFTNSRRTSELAVETLGIQPSRISICPPGVDDKFFQASAPGDQHQIRLLTVTRLTKHSARKNVDGVLRAIALLDGSPSVTYTVVGNGDDQTRLQELARSLGIADRVSFRGRLGDSQLLECYRNADLFILAAIASKRDVEGFGIVYIEAAAGGIPSICSRVGGAVDAVHEGENGLLIPDSSPEAIAAGIRRYAASRTTFSSDKARAIADRYRWPKVAGMLRERLASELDRLSNPNRDDRESAA